MKTIVALLICSSAGVACAADLTDEAIDRLAQPYVESDTVVGMTIGVVKGDQTVVRGYGSFSKSDSRVPDGGTIYEIGSVSKVFTGLLLADAVVQGRVTLNTPVDELLPKGVALNKRGDQPAALWHLATHTSGLSRIPDNMDPADLNNPYADYSGKQLAAFLKKYKPRKRPCEQIAYSNLGAGLLGDLLAREQKKSYEELLEERIIGPLGLENTSIELDAEAKQKLAPPHQDGGIPGHNWDFSRLAGCGAIRSTADDLLEFCAAHLDPPRGELGEAIGLAWCVHQKPIEKSDFAIGLGWHVAKDGSTRWHNGQTGGYHSSVFVSRPLDTAVVVLTNTATGEVDALAESLIQMLAGASIEPRKFEEPFRVSDEIMQRYEGTYEFAPGLALTVTVEDGRLMARLTGQQAVQVFPKSETEWRYKVVPAELTFKVDGSGNCTAVELFQNGTRQTATRTDGKSSVVEATINVAPEVMERYVGTYEFAPGMVLTVSIKQGRLFARLTGQQDLELVPESKTRWRCRLVDAKLKFQARRTGKATTVTLLQNGIRQVAKRIE